MSDELTLRAVGWLGDRVQSVGEVPEGCIDKLVDAYERKLIFTDYCGFHDCEICSDEEHCHPRGRIETVLEWEGQEIKAWRFEPNVAWKGQELTVSGLGHHLIRCGQIVYMAPALLLHYILGHQYKPPDEFVNAVIDGRFLTQHDLVFRPTMQFV